MGEAKTANDPTRPFEPLPVLVVGFAVGLFVGWVDVAGATWAAMLIGPIALGLAWWLARVGGGLVGVLAVLALAAAATGVLWWQVRGPQADPPDLGRYVQAESRLVKLSGRIVSRPKLQLDPGEGLASFLFSPPVTRFIVAVDTLHTERGDRPTRGGLLVRLTQLDTRPRLGNRVTITGWLAAIRPPSNPGEHDFAGAMARMGVVGKLFTESRANVRIIAPPPAAGAARPWAQWHAALTDHVARLLTAGIGPEADPASVALIEAMLLGRRSDALDELSVAFRRTGLAHLLAISGLHVGVMAAGVWWVVLLIGGRPRTATTAALWAVALYLAVVPWRVPILRAGFMTIVALAGLSWHRRVTGLSITAVIAGAWLVLRPGDLFNAGFQLSFGIVAALLLFTGPVTDRLVPPTGPMFDDGPRPWLRRGAEYLAVSLIAWLTALPIVVYHFNLISPLAVLLGIVMFPVVALLLWVGFAKIAIGLVAPAWGAALAGPVVALAELMHRSVSVAAELPGAWLEAPQPSALWAAATLAVVISLLAGRFGGRRAALAACVIVCGAWLYAPLYADRFAPADRRPALRIDMLAVGDGSCFVIRSRGRAMLFDCGSSNYAQIGRHTIVPALKAINVRRLDHLVISHADYDHFSGTLDVVDHVPTARIVTTTHVLDEAAARPGGATAYLVEQLRRRRVPIDTLAQGDAFDLGAARVEVIWPPPDAGFVKVHDNDSSLVLRFTVAGRRLMMCGDIQQVAMQRMIDEGRDIAADVTDLPHHGSFPPAAIDWLGHVGPGVVLQSSSWRRVRWDRWAEHLAGIDRHISARDGAVRLSVYPDGRIEARRLTDRR